VQLDFLGAGFAVRIGGRTTWGVERDRPGRPRPAARDTVVDRDIAPARSCGVFGRGDLAAQIDAPEHAAERLMSGFGGGEIDQAADLRWAHKGGGRLDPAVGLAGSEMFAAGESPEGRRFACIRRSRIGVTKIVAEATVGNFGNYKQPKRNSDGVRIPEAKNRGRSESAKDQMQREIALPTPLHAADLQFQAFAEFDGSRALSHIKCPTLVLTGDLDKLIPPQNSRILAKLIPSATLVVMPGGGHRVLWEAVENCTTLITEFLTSITNGTVRDVGRQPRIATPPQLLSCGAVSLPTWPLAVARATFETLSLARQLMLVGSSSRFGDGKPVVILSPRLIGGDIMLLPLSAWLKALGYRPGTADGSVKPDDPTVDDSLSQVVRNITRRVGRKAVLIAHSSSMTRALQTASLHKEWISDVVVFDAPYRSYTDGLRIHFVSFGWSALDGLIELPRLLRNIGIELIKESELDQRPSFGCTPMADGEHT
jgi:pimeloyl-ACP methyl ester carboxylesterase